MSRTILKQQLRKLLESSTSKSVDDGGKDSGRTGKKRHEETNKRRNGKGANLYINGTEMSLAKSEKLRTVKKKQKEL